jgi:hypothetical protein
MQIELELHYTNMGKESVILYKGSDIIFRSMISRNEDEAAAKQFEVEWSITVVTKGSSGSIEELSPGTAFVILRPGDSYKTRSSLAIPIVNGKIGGVSRAAAKGEHFLQVMVSTWPESERVAKRLRQRWKHIGFLWFEDIISTPMPLRFEEHPTVIDCSASS